MAFSLVNNTAELSDLAFLHSAVLVTCADVGVASVGVVIHMLRSWGLGS